MPSPMSSLLTFLTKPCDSLLATCVIATDLALLLQALCTVTAETKDLNEAASSVNSTVAKVRFDSR